MKRIPFSFARLAGWLLLPVTGLAQNYSLDWFTVGGGGTSTGGVFAMSTAIGQPGAYTMSAGNFTRHGSI